jgi:hypothetical protein
MSAYAWSAAIDTAEAVAFGFVVGFLAGLILTMLFVAVTGKGVDK